MAVCTQAAQAVVAMRMLFQAVFGINNMISMKDMMVGCTFVGLGSGVFSLLWICFCEHTSKAATQRCGWKECFHASTRLCHTRKNNNNHEQILFHHHCKPYMMARYRAKKIFSRPRRRAISISHNTISSPGDGKHAVEALVSRNRIVCNSSQCDSIVKAKTPLRQKRMLLTHVVAWLQNMKKSFNGHGGLQAMNLKKSCITIIVVGVLSTRHAWIEHLNDRRERYQW